MSTTTGDKNQRISMLKVLNPFHIWALGVGIVLVGEFMGWNFSGKRWGLRLLDCLLGNWFALYLCRDD